MTAIERTAYPRFKKILSKQELQTMYTPTPEEIALSDTKTQHPQSRLNLIVSLKCFQRLGYFPTVDDVPTTVTNHIRQTLSLSSDLPYNYQSRHTMQRHRQVIREYLQVTAYADGGETVVADVVKPAADTMGDPADLINIAIEELVHQRFELPAFSTLDRLVNHLQTQVERRLFSQISDQLTGQQKDQLDQLLILTEPQTKTPFTTAKQAPPSSTLSHMREWEAHLLWLESLLDVSPFLELIAPSRIQHLAAEAYALEPFNLRHMNPARRYTLLVCLLHQMQVQARDSLVEMFLKRMRLIDRNARDKLDLIREQQRETTEGLIQMMSTVAQQADETETDADLGQQVRALLAAQGGVEAVRDSCIAISAYHGNNYLPLLWPYYRTHRQNLFRLIDMLDLQPTTQDMTLLNALDFIKEHRHLRRTYLSEALPLGFANKQWRALVEERLDGQRVLNRRHLEICVFAHLAFELQTGDMAVIGSEQYADYRDQLLSWSDCQPHLADYCHQLGFPATAKDFVAELQDWLTQSAKTCDDAFPDNAQLHFEADGRPILKRLKRKAKPEGAEALRRALVAQMPERSVLDVLLNVERWVGYLSHFGPLSGSDPKISDTTLRYILTTFGYGCNLGATQTARHTRGLVTPQALAFINHQHITTDKLDTAIRDTINYYARFTLPRCWGLGQSAAADGTLIDLYDNNLLAEYHIRYGRYGGIAYHHVADNYIALFSHFISCGVWEAVYIIDGLLKNKSDIQPGTLHADTQGQSAPVFGLAHLLGIKLMPRIRNWKDLTLYRPDKETFYDHIDPLFSDVINWGLIETHWQDLMQVVISIQQGTVLPSMLLRKLGNRSRKNRLYRAFRELGRVVRTVFLLEFVSDPALRRQITATTNKVEAYNGFVQWIRFGDQGILKHRNPIEQEKRIKYNDLVANVLILQNVADMTRLLPLLADQGHIVTRETVATLGPYLTKHLRRFGDYFLDTDQPPEPFLFDLPFDI